MSQWGWGKPGTVIRGGWRCHRRGRGPGRPLAAEPALPAHLGRRFGDGVRLWLASLQCRERSQLPPRSPCTAHSMVKSGVPLYGQKEALECTVRSSSSQPLHSSQRRKNRPTDESRKAERGGERRKFLGLRPAHQRVVVLGLKSGEQAQPLSCSRGPSVLRPVAPGVLRLCGGGYRSGCHKPDRPLSSRARCLPPGLLLHL